MVLHLKFQLSEHEKKPEISGFRSEYLFGLTNMCCLHKIDDIENNAFTRFFALQQIIAMLFSFSLFSKDYLYITINITLRYAKK